MRWFLILLVSVVISAQASERIRVATFNVALEGGRFVERGQAVDRDTVYKGLQSSHPLVTNVATIIQHVRPDVLLINEIDSQSRVVDALLGTLRDTHLSQVPIDYPYYYLPPVNTGYLSPVDINKDGNIALPDDAYGYGRYEGQYGFVVLSRFPINAQDVVCLGELAWADMPGHTEVVDLTSGKPYYSSADYRAMRLSSKNHCDIPVQVGDTTVHILAAHPTPPVFDGPEDRNGARNFDEIRLWKDYLQGAAYLHADGLQDQRFVIVGDYNAAPDRGDSVAGAIQQLLDHPLIQQTNPASRGAMQYSPDKTSAAFDTSVWRMRIDYVLPSRFGFDVVDSGVFWPANDEPLVDLMGKEGSDHRLVYVDLQVVPD